MARPITDEEFQDVVRQLSCSSVDKRRKFEILKNNSNGIITPRQAIEILQKFKDAADRVKAIRLLEPRFGRMTCQEATQILGEFSLSGTDRLMALECLKRYLIDHQSTAGFEFLLSAFDNEKDKQCALSIAQTTVHYVADKLAAGGHQGYGATGGLYTQNWPLEVHLYGSLEEQMQRLPGHGEPSLPCTPSRVAQPRCTAATRAMRTHRTAAVTLPGRTCPAFPSPTSSKFLQDS
uniref:EF-hand domain-containing protein n=1 Tax=Macrostomum lignano TaxID=282301 RepID=A0A1I8FT89_9PLAT